MDKIKPQSVQRITWAEVHTSIYALLVALEVLFGCGIDYMTKTRAGLFLAWLPLYVALTSACVWSVRRTLLKRYLATPHISGAILAMLLSVLATITTLAAAIYGIIFATDAKNNHASTFAIYIALLFIMTLQTGLYTIYVLMCDVFPIVKTKKLRLALYA